MSLPPYSPQLGPQVYKNGLYSDETELIMLPEQLLSRPSVNIAITTARGREVCRVKDIGHRQRLFTSANGQADLFLLRPRPASVSDYHGKSFTGSDFTVHTHFRIIGARSTISFQNAADSRPYELTVNGDWLDDTVIIRHGQQLIAEITKAPEHVRQSQSIEPSVSTSGVVHVPSKNQI